MRPCISPQSPSLPPSLLLLPQSTHAPPPSPGRSCAPARPTSSSLTGRRQRQDGRRSSASSFSRVHEPTVQFIYRWDLEWCPVFGKLKTLTLNNWFMAIDLDCILQHSPVLEMLTLRIDIIKSFVGATGSQETIEQPSVCARRLAVTIECHEVDQGVHEILNMLSACGILREQICFSDMWPW
ncbi:hypothetical protein ACQJBY_057415 [Aegilops geniculata]